MESSILIGSGIVVSYTLLGGFWAVSLTDTLQGFMMALAAIVLPLAALIAVGGPGALADGLAAIPDADSATRSGFSAVAGFALALLGIGLGYPGQPHVVNRFMALRDDAGLRRGRIIAIAWAVVVYAGMLVLGWCGRVLFTLGDKEVVFIVATRELFPPVVAGVMLAAVLSAIMSTADSQLLVAASAVTHDLGLGGGSTPTMMRRSRWVVLLLSAAAAAAAMVGSQEIFKRVLFAWSAMGAAFGPLLLVVVLRGPVAPRWAVAAMASGFTLSVAAYLTPGAAGTAMERVLPVLVALVLALVGQRRAL
jgi:sodium/proline symporter